MIYIGNIEILTAKSAIYLGNVGYDSFTASPLGFTLKAGLSQKF